mgnify:FL=1
MITLMLLLSQAALAGAPWVRGPGEAYTKMGWSHFRADASVAPGGLVLDDVRYQGNSGTFYGEVGLAKWAHAVVLLPFSSGQNRVDDVVFVNRGFGDGLLGVVLGAPVGPVPVSLTLRSKLPLYDNAELLRYGDAGQRFPALGDGQVDLDAVVSAGSGISLGPVRGWVMGELGYRHRTEWWMGDGSSPDRQLADGMLWTAQLGWSPRWRDRDLGWLFVQGDGVGSMVDDAVTRRLVQLSSGVGVKVWKGLAVELGGSSVVWAEAAAPGWGLSAGASWTWGS